MEFQWSYLYSLAGGVAAYFFCRWLVGYWVRERMTQWESVIYARMSRQIDDWKDSAKSDISLRIFQEEEKRKDLEARIIKQARFMIDNRVEHESFIDEIVKRINDKQVGR